MIAALLVGAALAAAPPSWVVGGGLAAGAENLDYGPVDLTGGTAGFALWGRGVIDGPWIWAVAFHPQVSSELLPDHYDDNWVYRARVPIRAGARWTAPVEAVTLDVGLDWATLVLGRFEERQRLRVARLDQAAQPVPHDPAPPRRGRREPALRGGDRVSRVVLADVVQVVRHRALHVALRRVDQPVQQREPA